MCTVTLIPKGKTDFILTSNRDEAPNRLSLPPEFHTIDGTTILFPKDELSGGTWVGISDKGRVICLLNGGFELHQRRESYRLSRGVVVKDLMISGAIVEAVSSYNFENIEPFTIVIADWNYGLNYYELIWDGEQKHFTELPQEPRVWSSSTLYNESMREVRQQWFEDFKSKHPLLETSALLEFHKTAGKGNLDYGAIMDRGFVMTTSITQIHKEGGHVGIYHENLIKHQKTSKTFKLPQSIHG